MSGILSLGSSVWSGKESWKTVYYGCESLGGLVWVEGSVCWVSGGKEQLQRNTKAKF